MWSAVVCGFASSHEYVPAVFQAGVSFFHPSSEPLVAIHFLINGSVVVPEWEDELYFGLVLLHRVVGEVLGLFSENVWWSFDEMIKSYWLCWVESSDCSVLFVSHRVFLPRFGGGGGVSGVRHHFWVSLLTIR